MISIGSSTTHYKDTQVTNGISYVYKVCAENALGGESLSSNFANAKPAGPPPSNANRDWFPVVGDFIQYNVSYDAATGLDPRSEVIIVVSTNPPDTMTLNLSMGFGGFYFEGSHSRAALFGGNYFSADFDIYNHSSSITANFLGNVSLTTLLGTRTAEHWTYSYGGVSGELWILNGVILQGILTDSGHVLTYVVEDTNIHHVLSP